MHRRIDPQVCEQVDEAYCKGAEGTRRGDTKDVAKGSCAFKQPDERDAPAWEHLSISDETCIVSCSSHFAINTPERPGSATLSTSSSRDSAFTRTQRSAPCRGRLGGVLGIQRRYSLRAGGRGEGSDHLPGGGIMHIERCRRRTRPPPHPRSANRPAQRREARPHPPMNSQGKHLKSSWESPGLSQAGGDVAS